MQVHPMKWLPILMFWLLGMIWGSSFIYMKMASHYISPIQIVLLRVLFGLFPLALYAKFTGAFNRSHIKYVHHFLFMAAVGTIGYYYGFTKATSLLPSGIAGTLSGLTPILSFILALIFLDSEKVSIYRALGIGGGFLGVFLIARPTGAGISITNIEGILYSILGSLSVGAAFIYAKRFVIPLNIPIAAVVTYQLSLSLLIMLLIVDLDGIGDIWCNPYVAAGLVLGLGVLGTGVAFIIYYYIIDKLGAVSASSVAYIPPVVAMGIGFVFVGETIRMLEAIGAAFVFLGLVLVNKATKIGAHLTEQSSKE